MKPTRGGEQIRNPGSPHSLKASPYKTQRREGAGTGLRSLRASPYEAFGRHTERRPAALSQSALQASLSHRRGSVRMLNANVNSQIDYGFNEMKRCYSYKKTFQNSYNTPDFFFSLEIFNPFTSSTSSVLLSNVGY